ncbi:MAG TPA: DUF1175 domain-containing protein, partial [Terriglobales bacterium]|nr:DUF1175 domain-containing protein [Terriglobales bacterium]
AFGAHLHRIPVALVITIDHDFLPADGHAEAHVELRATDGRDLDGLKLQSVEGRSIAQLTLSNDGPVAHALLRSSVQPGNIVLQAKAPKLPTAKIIVHTALDPSDEFGDGTPDFLRLDEADRQSFRRWFTFLAESTYVQDPKNRPTEVADCAALIRYAYREALKSHEGSWANDLHLPATPKAASIQKYQYPYTPLAANLFRVEPGPFTPRDLSSKAFAEFADAETLRRFNTYFVSRDLSAARPGDLIFYRQSGEHSPFHSMIYLGHSYFSDGDQWVIYHTGPAGKDPGEIRRVTIDDLKQHPDARWRPVPQNPAFLGVYRWNILREAN